MLRNHWLNSTLELRWHRSSSSSYPPSFSKNSSFGFEGMAFIAEFGIMIPISHLADNVNQAGQTIGQKVLMLNPQTRNSSDFVSLNTPDTSSRPVGIAFNKNESALYVASIGKVEVRTTLPDNGAILSDPVPWYYPNTRVIWKVINSNSNTTDGVR